MTAPATAPPADPRREEQRARARLLLGIEGPGGDQEPPPLRRVVAESGAGWYVVLVLSLLVVVDQFHGYVFTTLGPEIARSLGLSAGTIGTLAALKLMASACATLPMAAFVQRRPRRAAVSIAAALAWSVVTVGSGLVIGLPGLATVVLLDGLSTGSVRAVHQPLLLDSYPPEGRVRALSLYRGADQLSLVLAPLSVALLTGVLGFTWRGVFLAMGCASLAAALGSLGLRDRGFGRWDTARIRSLVRRDQAVDAPQAGTEQAELGFFEIMRRLLLIPTQRRILAAFAVLGVMLVPFSTFFAFYLDERWGLGPGSRAMFTAVTSAAAVVALVVFAKRGERLFRQDPARLVRTASVLLFLTVVCIGAGALMPVFWLMTLFFSAAFALVAVLQPAFFAAQLSIVPPAMRPHASALAAIYLAAVGGVGGALLLGSIDRRFGVTGAIVVSTLPGVVGALLLHRAAATINDDLDRMIDEIVEEEEVRQLTHSGRRPPLLACRGVDFSYGSVQTLFGVDFTVDEGEIVALLGVNGAGKSTLLRVISGLGLPTRGSLRFRGHDITYLDAERRVSLGIAQVPGGRAVFPGLSVVENLRSYAYTLRRPASEVDRAIEAALEGFPSLAARRNQPAETLSGGEQQMLGLVKAFLLSPRVLLVDELSLGLSPKVVGSVLDVVREINRQGTAVVLVEQSVNVALSVVDHAYFMEKGEIRFDGKAGDLLGRDDLLRSVFLEGAANALGGAPAGGRR